MGTYTLFRKRFLFCSLLCIVFFTFAAGTVSAQGPQNIDTGSSWTTLGASNEVSRPVITGQQPESYIYHWGQVYNLNRVENGQAIYRNRYAEGLTSGLADVTGVASLKSLPLKIAFAIGGVLLGIIASILSFLASILVHISVYFFDIALVIATDGLSQIVASGSATAEAIKKAWIIIRDLANIGFVFILLYIAINFILSAESSSTKKLLSNTILAAVLINFSFFFAAVVVDVANQLAVELRTDVDLVWKNNGASSLAEFIIKSTKVDETVSAIKSSTDMGSGDSGSQIAGALEGIDSGNASLLDRAIQWGIGSTMMFILMLVLAITFIIASFILIARTIVLILLLITSPIGFAGFVLPYTQKIAKEWWQSLVGQAFFLPVFLLFILIAVKLIEAKILGINFTPVSETATSIPVSGVQKDIVTLGKNIAGGVIQYAIVIGLFIAALTSAKKLSSMGSDIVTKLSGSITSTVGGAALGVAGYAGRNTIGRAANLSAESFKNSRLAGTIPGRYALEAMRGVAGSSFDARQGRVFKGVAEATGLSEKDYGKAGGKGGYSSQLDKQIASNVKYASSLGELAETDPRVATEKNALTQTTAARTQAEQILETLKQRGAPQKQIDKMQATVDRFKEREKARQVELKQARSVGRTYQKTLEKWGAVEKYWGSQKRRGSSEKIDKELTKDDAQRFNDKLLNAISKINQNNP